MIRSIRIAGSVIGLLVCALTTASEAHAATEIQNGVSIMWYDQFMASAPNQYMVSANQQYILRFQTSDCNLVLSDSSGNVLWASGSQWYGPLSRGCYLDMQNDGDLVMTAYAWTPTGHPFSQVIWKSGTWGYSGTYFVVQNDGNLVIYAPGGKPIWDRYNGAL